jgi:hypothetical protein
MVAPLIAALGGAGVAMLVREFLTSQGAPETPENVNRTMRDPRFLAQYVQGGGINMQGMQESVDGGTANQTMIDALMQQTDGGMPSEGAVTVPTKRQTAYTGKQSASPVPNATPPQTIPPEAAASEESGGMPDMLTAILGGSAVAGAGYGINKAMKGKQSTESVRGAGPDVSMSSGNSPKSNVVDAEYWDISDNEPLPAGANQRAIDKNATKTNSSESRINELLAMTDGNPAPKGQAGISQDQVAGLIERVIRGTDQTSGETIPMKKAKTTKTRPDKVVSEARKGAQFKQQQAKQLRTVLKGL